MRHMTPTSLTLETFGARLTATSHLVDREGETGAQQLHVYRIHGQIPGQPVLLLHGTMSSGRTFYSHSGKGLAPWLAAQGFDVFVPDFSGRGRSRPAVSRGVQHGLHGEIVEDLPAFSAFVAETSGQSRQLWLAHSWGGVIGNACLARVPEVRDRVRGTVWIAPRRVLSVRNWEALLGYHLGWRLLGSVLTPLVGYFPGKALKIGSDNDPARFFHEVSTWLRPGSPWVDPTDGFDYGAAAKRITFPPALWVTGAGETHLGHPSDVQALMEACGQGAALLKVIGRAQGYGQDYGHVDILLHQEGPTDHFPMLAQWLKEQRG